MNRVRKVIHAEPAEVFPYTGAGVTAAILDTGFAMHPDLEKRLVGFRDFCGGSSRPYDDSGHGTHVAGCLCGSGACSRGLYAGIAPRCRIVAGKVLDENGEGAVEDMIAGIRYVLETRKLYQTRILNISVGINHIEEKGEQEELVSWLEEAWYAGLFVVVAAGNKGPGNGSISRLGLSEHVVAVGCHDGKNFWDKCNACENYSGRGKAGARVRKPDLVAPGTEVISCNAGFRKKPMGGVWNPYLAKSGSSMSVPMVSAAAALLWEKYPFFSNEQIKERILRSAVDLGEAPHKQGWGMVNVRKGLTDIG